MWYLNSRLSPDGHRLTSINPFVDGSNKVLPGVCGIARTVIFVIREECPRTATFCWCFTYDPLLPRTEPDRPTIIRFFLVPIPSIKWSLLDNVMPIVRLEEVVGPFVIISSFGPANLDLVRATCKVHFAIDALFFLQNTHHVRSLVPSRKVVPLNLFRQSRRLRAKASSRHWSKQHQHHHQQAPGRGLQRPAWSQPELWSPITKQY